MTSCVNLFDRLLADASQLRRLGRVNDAFARLTRLVSFPDLPPAVAAEAHLLLAETLIKRGKPMRARKHLKKVLSLTPDDARARRLMGEAQEGGRLPDPYAALEHYRRSLELRPDDAECLSAAGKLAVRQGLGEEGTAYLTKAANLAADDPKMLRSVVDGLLLANRADEVRGLLRTAMFRHARDRRYRTLWNHVQFQQLRKEQGEARAAASKAEADDGPVLLTFAAERVTAVRRKAQSLRLDGPSALPGPHPVLVGRRSLRRSVR